MKIGITRNSSEEEIFNKYKGWLLRLNPAIEFCDLVYSQSTTDQIESCDGLLLTGGGDIDPKAFGREDGGRMAHDVDKQRDTFEFELIGKALRRKMPLLGICRGLQSTNVFLGGSLYLDLEAAGFSSHTERDGKDSRHSVTIEEHSMLGAITGETAGVVSSTHHQGVDVPAADLVVGARSDDGVVEALEWKEKKGKSFLLLLQWHPERMMDTYNPLTEKVGRTFLEEVRHYRKCSIDHAMIQTNTLQ